MIEVLSIQALLTKILPALASSVQALPVSVLQTYISGLINYLANHEAVHKSMQPSYLYEDGDYKLYFTDCQYRKGGFKRQDLYYHRKIRMKRTAIDKTRDRENIMMS